MSLNIRKKLLATFSAMLIPLMILAAMGYIHNRATHRAASLVETISEERVKAEGLRSEMERVLMPVHDYIITGDRKYINAFREASAVLERRIAEAEEILPGTATPHVLEEREILDEVRTAWAKIKGISSRVFAIPHLAENREAAGIMEEMDYKLAYPAIGRLKRWQEIDAEEYRKAVEAANRLRHLTWGVMAASIFIMTALGILFSLFYSRRFVMPIEAIRRRANEIAGGSFTGKIDIKTGDELEELANAMNGMSAKLNDLYSELRESEERYHRLFNGGNDVVLAHPITSEGKPGRFIEVNDMACEMLGYSKEELLSLSPLEVQAPEMAEKSEQAIKELSVKGKAIFVTVGVRKDGGRVPVEVNARLFDIKGQPMVLSIARDITERKRMEEALRFEHSKLLNILETMEDGVYITNQRHEIEYINPALEREFGPTKGRRCYEYLDNRKEPCPWCKNREVFQGNTVRWEWASNNGKTYDLIDTPLRNPDGTTSKLEILRDVTEQKRSAYLALEESERRYRYLVESVTDYIYTVKVENGRPVSTTHGPACISITGYAPREFEADPLLWLRMVPEEDRQPIMEQAEKVLAGRETPPVVHRIIHKDGRTKWVENTIVPRYSKEGRLISYDGLISDVTKRKEAEDAVERAKREWEATFDGISDPIFIHDSDFRIIRANKAYSEKAGMPYSQIIGRPYYEIFPKMDGPHNACRDAIDSRQQAEDDIYLPSVDRTFKGRFYPIADMHGNYLYSAHIMEDVTEEKMAEEKLKGEMDVTSHLLMISEATAHTADMDRLMEQVVRCSSNILGCDICLSYLWDMEERVFRPGQAHGLPHEMTPLFMTETLGKKVWFVKDAMEKKGPVVTPLASPLTLRGDSGGLNWLPEIDTIAVIPLIAKRKNLGLIVGIYTKCTVSNCICAEISERDIKIMEGISHQVSMAIEEAHLYKETIDRAMELSHKMETIQVMHEIDRSILSTLKPQEILETATRMASRLVPCDSSMVAIVDKERKGFVCAAGCMGSSDIKGRFVAFEDTTLSDVVETGRPQYIANLKDEKRPLPREKELIADGILSVLRIPVSVKGEVAAILFIGARRPSAYTPDDLATIGKVAAQIGVALENGRLLKDIEDLFLGTVRSLSSAIDAKSPWTAGHSERVTSYALLIGANMGLSEDELKDLNLAGLLHDIGKIGTYEAVLDKPGALNEDEKRIIRLHPVKGAEILAPIRQLKDVIPAIKHHHEFYDGTGYPDGLKGEKIPLFARILTVADTVDAMSADRPYRKGRTMDVIAAELKRCSGTQFDQRVVEAFLKANIS